MLKIINTCEKPLLVLAVVLLTLGFGWALWLSPQDYQMGETVRIMYMHVPASWGALAAYTVMAGASAYGLIRNHMLSHLICRSVALVGAVMCAISLLTGSIWGKPTWGTYWVWDARLTSMLFLFFLYLGYFAVLQQIQSAEKAMRISAMVAVLGWLNVPIIKGSVEWWHTLHQPASLMRLSKPAIHPEMLMPLLIMTTALVFFGAWIVALRLRTLILARQNLGRRMRLQQDHIHIQWDQAA